MQPIIIFKNFPYIVLSYFKVTNRRSRRESYIYDVVVGKTNKLLINYNFASEDGDKDDYELSKSEDDIYDYNRWLKSSLDTHMSIISEVYEL